MTAISVGLRNNLTVSVDMADVDDEGEEGTWSFKSLDIEEAEFLRDELDAVIQRAHARRSPRPRVLTEGPRPDRNGILAEGGLDIEAPHERRDPQEARDPHS